MEIEIVTTKRKLTKSLVGQMRHAPVEVMHYGDVLGFMVNVVPKTYKAALLQSNPLRDRNYYVLPLNYTQYDMSVSRAVSGRGHSRIVFDTEAACEYWWKGYTRVKDLATIQIYI